MKNKIFLLFLSCFFFCFYNVNLSAGCNLLIQTGAEQIDEMKKLTQGKRVGIVVNQTSVLGEDKVHLLDALLAEKVNVAKIFVPEHGFRGTADAGATIKDSKDQKTGLPVISLYGKNKKPTTTQLADLDVILFDLQDVGTRFFTYISTMHYVLEACAETDKYCVILDRPNPNDFVDGPVLKKGFTSFVGMHAIPVLHGLTVGELALMINQEGWIGTGKNSCKISVVKVVNWKHGQPYSLPVKPSPNLPNDQAITLYPSLCFFEATPVSIGRGTYFPFQVIGYPDPSFGEFSFTPETLPGFDTNPLQKGKTCYGVDLREVDFPGGLSLQFILDFYEKMGKDPKKFFTRPEWFDLLSGEKRLREQITRGMTEEQIRASWQEELEEYKQMRKKYLLYPDYNDLSRQ
ncbi:MAG: DUF1343 domain-containing protein [Tannerellaceae bacterium]|nr:DUF1343 domain-containing protein [Tannerellaceae bacterium]